MAIRVLHVVTDLNRGGLETLLMNYYRQINKKQIQFDFLTHRRYLGDYGPEAVCLGSTIYHLRRLNPFSKVYRKELSLFFANHPQYQIVHVHQDCMSSIILKAAAQHGVPVRIAHSHSSSQDKNLKYPIKLFYRHFIPRYSTHRMACSKEAGDWMFEGADYQILNNAVDSQAYAFSPQTRARIRALFKIPDDVKVIGHVGRFSEVKNHAFLIDVFDAFQKKIPAMLMLVGDGNLRADIEQKVNALGLRDKVIFTGVRNDVAELLQAMDVFAFPSLYEGLPMTLVEAQAAGLPCVISERVPIECGITDLVRQLSLGEGAQRWAEQLISAADNTRRNTSEEIKAAGYDIASNAKWLEEFYTQINDSIEKK